MKSLIIYKSIHHQNTLKIAQIMAEELNADISTPEDIDIESLDQYDLIGIGSGIYFAKHHRSILDLVKRLDNISGKKVFVFYTSGFTKFPTRPPFETKLTKQLVKKSANIVGTFSCRGLETYGPFRIGGGKNKGHPNDDDFEQARKFVRSLVEK